MLPAATARAPQGAAAGVRDVGPALHGSALLGPTGGLLLAGAGPALPAAKGAGPAPPRREGARGSSRLLLGCFLFVCLFFLKERIPDGMFFVKAQRDGLGPWLR